MLAGQEGLSEEELIALTSDLQGLSGKYGTTEWRADGTIISNDEGFRKIVPNLKSRLSDKHGGIGLFVGSGGLLSMYPDLPIDTALVLDMNPAVLEFNELLAELIQASSFPDQVFQQLASPAFRARSRVLRERDVIYENHDNLIDFLRAEMREYGEWHWSHPARFAAVKEALRKKPIIHAAVDITNPNFGIALSDIAGSYGEQIAFANFSNVHAWIKGRGTDFVRNWPFQSDAAIVYGDEKHVGHFPTMSLVKGPEEYIQQTKENVR